MDLVLWILVGLTAGLVVALVTPAMGPPTRSDSARRRVRAMATSRPRPATIVGTRLA